MQGSSNWRVPVPLLKSIPGPGVPENPIPGSTKPLMPTERKSMWKTAEERRLSDLTRVLEWMERRQGKRKRVVHQKPKVDVGPKAKEKEERKGKGAGAEKPQREGHRVSFQEQTTERSSGRVEEAGRAPAPPRSGPEPRARRVSIAAGSFLRDVARKGDLDIKDALDSTTRPSMFRRQSSVMDPMFPDTLFAGRRMTLVRDWTGKMPDSTYERKLKSLMEKGAEPKLENAKMLKPEEVLSCRYLRLSKNNIRTLLKLCKDAGMNVDIHPHMVETEIDAKKVFSQVPSVSL